MVIWWYLFICQHEANVLVSISSLHSNLKTCRPLVLVASLNRGGIYADHSFIKLFINENCDNCWYFCQFWTILDNFCLTILTIFDKGQDKDNPRALWHLSHWLNSDNWEPEFMTIFLNWQLKVTVDTGWTAFTFLQCIKLYLNLGF